MTTLQQISELKRERALQCRAKGTDKRTAEEYAEALKKGAVFPPIVVFRDPDGVLWLSDGFHRVAGAERAGLAELEADVREGTRQDALLFAASANAEHGRPRTTEDKRHAVLALHAQPEWRKRAARWIAEHCKVSPTFAAETIRTVHGGQLEATEGKDGKVRKPKASNAATSEPADLVRVYVGILKRRTEATPREHHDALMAALHVLHPDASAADVMSWFANSVEPIAPPAAKKRRIVEQKGDVASTGVAQ